MPALAKNTKDADAASIAPEVDNESTNPDSADVKSTGSKPPESSTAQEAAEGRVVKKKKATRKKKKAAGRSRKKSATKKKTAAGTSGPAQSTTDESSGDSVSEQTDKPDVDEPGKAITSDESTLSGQSDATDEQGKTSTVAPTVTETSQKGSTVEPTPKTASAEAPDESETSSESSAEQQDESFVYILDEPESNPSAAGAEQSLSGENDDAFLILFDNDDDDDEDQEATVEISDAGECKISMPSDIRVSRLNALKECFIHSLEAKTVEIDVSSVRRTDTASFQLLWAYSAKLSDLNVPLNINGASDEFTNSASVLGLEL